MDRYRCELRSGQFQWLPRNVSSRPAVAPPPDLSGCADVRADHRTPAAVGGQAVPVVDDEPSSHVGRPPTADVAASPADLAVQRRHRPNAVTGKSGSSPACGSDHLRRARASNCPRLVDARCRCSFLRAANAGVRLPASPGAGVTLEQPNTVVQQPLPITPPLTATC